VELMAADNSASFRAGIVELLPKLRRFAFSLCGTAHDADDLVQTAVERALRSEGRWQADTRLDSWMYKLMQNLWIDQARQSRTRGVSAPLEAALAVVGDDARVLLDARASAAIAIAAFARLSPEIRAAASLVILNGHSYREAADALGVPLGTIMSRVARARRSLGADVGPGVGE
jgi:RNA polymerase sigma-70 factor (ECF subfamily)